MIVFESGENDLRLELLSLVRVKTDAPSQKEFESKVVKDL